MIYSDAPVKFKKGKLLSGIVYPEFFPLTENDTVLNVGCGDGVQALVYDGQFKSMVGVDINPVSLATARALADYYHYKNYELIQADVEAMPLAERFDKIIAIDIIEHVIHPQAVLKEISRLLADGGQALITFPAMHDKWEKFFRFIGRVILRRRGRTTVKKGWDPDVHQYDYSLAQWLRLAEQSGLKLKACRASTLWPPLHYLGLPRFWFANKIIHRLDKFFCQRKYLKNFGQSLVCVFEK